MTYGIKYYSRVDTRSIHASFTLSIITGDFLCRWGLVTYVLHRYHPRGANDLKRDFFYLSYARNKSLKAFCNKHI